MPPFPHLTAGSPYDVLVVGAGTAGAATALRLARASLRVLLLDPAPLGAAGLSTCALTRGGVLLLSRWGVLDRIASTGTPPVRRTTFRYADEEVVISVKPSHGVDALYAPRRSLLDGVLREAAVDTGVDVAACTSVDDLLRRDGRVVGVRAGTPDGPVEVEATLVIGADGASSAVAARAGAGDTRIGTHASAVTYGYWSGLETDGYEWTFRPDACSGVVPTNDGLACVLASASPERIGTGGVARIHELVAEGAPSVGERLGRAAPPRRAHTWQPERGRIRRSHGLGWALVGEAGCSTDPIGSHAINGDLRDAELLAEAVVGAFGDDAALAAALGLYEATRDRLATPLFDLTDRLAGHRWDDTEIAERLVQLSSAMATEVDALAALPTIEPEVTS